MYLSDGKDKTNDMGVANTDRLCVSVCVCMCTDLASPTPPLAPDDDDPPLPPDLRCC